MDMVMAICDSLNISEPSEEEAWDFFHCIKTAINRVCDELNKEDQPFFAIFFLFFVVRCAGYWAVLRAIALVFVGFWKDV